MSEREREESVESSVVESVGKRGESLEDVPEARSLVRVGFPAVPARTARCQHHLAHAHAHTHHCTRTRAEKEKEKEEGGSTS
jgi:hypothetical protein